MAEEQYLDGSMTEDEHAAMAETYEALAHGVQSATRFLIERGEGGESPKHVRTGLNLIMADHATLVLLLIEKGVMTHREYMEAVIAGTRRELDRLTDHARYISGLNNITFG